MAIAPILLAALAAGGVAAAGPPPSASAARDGAATPGADAAQPEDGAGPPAEDAGPPGEDAGPPGEGAGPPGEGAGPPDEGAGPPGEGAGPPGEGAGPPGEGAGPPGEDAGPPELRPAAGAKALVDPGLEIIDDPQDPTGSAASAPGARGARTPALGAAGGVLWVGRARARQALDLAHQGPRAGEPGAYHEDVTELLAEAIASVEVPVTERLRLVVGARTRLWVTTRRPEAGGTFVVANGDRHRSDFELDVLDTYLSLARGGLGGRAGVVTEVWGVTDLVNPNDVLTARDLRGGLFLDPEAGRLPVPMISGTASLAGLVVTACLLPAHVSNRFDLYGSDYALFGPIAPRGLQWLGELADAQVDDSIEPTVQAALRESQGPRALVEPAFAARASRRLAGWDVALQGGTLHERIPVFRLDPLLVLALAPLFADDGSTPTAAERAVIGEALAAQPFPVDASVRRQHHAGLSVAGALGGVAAGLDAAWLSREAVALAGELPFVEDEGWLATSTDSQVVAATAGALLVRGERLSLTVEAWYRVLLDLARAPVEERPELLLGGPHFAGVALHGRYHVARPDLTWQLVVHADAVNRSLVVAPRVTWRRGDHLGLSVGADVYEGADRSLGGRLDQNDQVYVAVEGFL